MSYRKFLEQYFAFRDGIDRHAYYLTSHYVNENRLVLEYENEGLRLHNKSK